MDRIFNPGSIEQICEEIKSILNECKDHMETMRSTASEAQQAVAGVPSDVRDASVDTAAEALKSAISGTDGPACPDREAAKRRRRADAEVEETYAYDKRGNLSQVTANGQIKNQYLYGALNRLEQAVNGKGEAARYQYNGLGHRVGKEIGQENFQTINEGLDPIKRLQSQTVSPEKQVQYTIDLTREYHNLLQKEEDNHAQTFLWDGNVAGIAEGTRENRQYYLQDELGSPLRLADEEGHLRDSYGYDEFGQDLYGNQGKVQPFGYTGYQKDCVAGTYFAQAREYIPGTGHFTCEDIIKGFSVFPITLNGYTYCINNPQKYKDDDGRCITIAIGTVVGGLVGGIGSVASQMLSGKKISEINWKDVGVDALSGAATGALAGTGVGLVGLAAGGAAVGAGNYVGKTSLNNEWRTKTVTEHLIDDGLSTMEWSIAAVAGGTMKAEATAMKGLEGEYRFASTMLRESASGIPAQRFYSAVSKDIIKAIGKTTWNTFWRSLIRTGIVGAVDTLYNTYGKEPLTDIINEQIECLTD